LESFRDYIDSKPKIIHISCHGAKDKDCNEFHLVFENYNNDNNGVSVKIKGSELEEILGKSDEHGI